MAILSVHGRGQNPEIMQDFASFLNVPGARFYAPSAEGATWYPEPFLEPLERNQPQLDLSLALIPQYLTIIASAGFTPENTVLWGFSQGACLLSHFLATRHYRCGGAVLFTGGHLGPGPLPEHAGRPLTGMPVLMRTIAEDPWVPRWRVRETAATLTRLGANVDLKVAPGTEHIITAEAFEAASELINTLAPKKGRSPRSFAPEVTASPGPKIHEGR
ncbi:alpha/beta hydrolase [Pseudarthrobacter oxydans]|uniref:alpha/beta hydrolase n=1 Tax=Pseudarthrobacter oxydans TaxID=1671 RepID=UPI0038050D5E